MRTLSLLVLFVSVSGLACKKSTAKPCPAKYHDVAAADQKADFTCSCAADAASGTVWGSKIFTVDSSICGAAVHAGALKAKTAGDVTVRHAAGCPAYTGSAANGVTSQAWPSYPDSFFFPSNGDGKCGAAPATPPASSAGSSMAAMMAPGSSSASSTVAMTMTATGGECPALFNMVPNYMALSDYSCTCSTVPKDGSVWGSGIYTDDSNICRAAAHAGAFGKLGTGPVKIKGAVGCGKYVGTTANTVQSENWGSHGHSFYFDGKGDGKCAM